MGLLLQHVLLLHLFLLLHLELLLNLVLQLLLLLLLQLILLGQLLHLLLQLLLRQDVRLGPRSEAGAGKALLRKPRAPTHPLGKACKGTQDKAQIGYLLNAPTAVVTVAIAFASHRE